MIKRLVVASALLFIPFFIFGQTLEDFNNIVDFNATIASLSNAAEKGNVEALPEKIVIIDGTVAERYVIQSGTDNFVGQLNIVGGKWIGVEEVVMYQCILLLQGEKFSNAIPARRTRNPHPDEIQVNSRIMVVGKVLALHQMQDGETVPVLDAYYIRKVE